MILNFLKKKKQQKLLIASREKLLITSRGFSGTIFLLSFLSALKNSVVAWKCPHDSKYFPSGITIFGLEQEECYIAGEKEINKGSLLKIFTRMITKQISCDLYCIGHWFDLHDIETKYGSKYLQKKNIQLINLVRHPIDRTHSNWHGLRTAFSQTMPKNHKQGFIHTINDHKTWLGRFLMKHNISLDNIKDVTFIGACLNLFACSLDASYQMYQHIKIESLNNENLMILLENISNGKIKLDGNDIEKINTQTIQNSHLATFHQKSPNIKHQDNISMTTYEKFSSWLPWQRELYKLCVIKSKLNEYYQQHQYNLYLEDC